MHEDRRLHPRLDCHLDINLKPGLGITNLDGVTPLGELIGIPAISKNFSLNGLCIKTGTRALKKRDRVYLTINTPTEVHPIELESEVAWSSGDEIGINFINVNTFDELRLRDCFEFFRDVYVLQETAHILM
jgi:hypothetical protein